MWAQTTPHYTTSHISALESRLKVVCHVAKKPARNTMSTLTGKRKHDFCTSVALCCLYETRQVLLWARWPTSVLYLLNFRGAFVPLVVESLDLWSAASHLVLQDIAFEDNHQEWNFLWPCKYWHLLEQLFVCLLCHNARTFLHLFSLLPGSSLWELNTVLFSQYLQFGQ